MMLFADYAPRYWNAGLQVMPLRERTKRPLLNVWQQWGKDKLPDDVKCDWLDHHPEANIGLPAGPASNICFIDIDTTDLIRLKAIEDALPKSPWRRVGAKGCVLAFKYNGAASFKILENKKPLVEFFSTSGQVVVPPSIHPDTGMAYYATTNLWDVVNELPAIDPDIENILRRELKLKVDKIKLDIEGLSRLSDTVSIGNRDTAMIKRSGTFAYDIIKGRRTLKEALDLLSDWSDVNVEKLSGDDMDLNKGLKNIVRLLMKDVKVKGLVLPKGWDDGIDAEQKKKLGLDVLTEEDISFDHNEIKQNFLTELAEFEEKGGQNNWPVIERTLRRIARSTNTSEYEKDMLLDLIKEHCGKHVKLASLRKGLKTMENPGIEGTSHTEIAQAVIDDLKEIEMRFDQGWLWEWRGSHWGKKDQSEIMTHIAQRYGHLPAARRQSDHSGVAKVINALVTKPIHAAGPKGINFTNGFLTTDLRLIPHDPDFGATYEMPYPYNPELVDKCPKFMAFLANAWDGDKQRVQALREAIAVTLFGLAPKFEKCFLLHGVPAGGKSVTLDVVSSLVPPEARASLSPQQFADKFKLAELAGKILNEAGELPDNRFIQSDIFKKIISGQGATVEKKNKDPFEFKANCGHWFAANNLPQTNDVSGGFVRRWLIFGFYKERDKEKRNVNLAEEIIVEERPAIVAWAVEALPGIMKNNKLTDPPDSLSLSAEMQHSINTIRSWFEEAVEKKPHAALNEAPAYAAYRTWCMQKGHKRRETGDFKRTMREIAGNGSFRCESSPTGDHTYIDIKLKRAA